VSLKVYLRPEAETDIEEAAIWYEEQRQGLGQEFLDDVLSLCETVSENPAIYPVVHRRTRRALIRQFPFGVYFRIEDKQVIVVAVIHGSRHPRRWRQRR
jgi:plasmid stabilization system protein ParE